MKKIVLSTALIISGLFATSKAQIQKGNWMVGGNVANMTFTNGFNMNLTPKLGYFVMDNWVIGGEVNLNVYSPKGTGVTQTNWGVGAFTRYYFGDSQIDSILKNGRFFGEGNVGFSGINSGAGSSTNGLGLGIGAGYSYFITKNVGLEALLKYDGVVGGGNSSTNGNLGLAIGFQIYIPSKTAKAAIQDKQ